MSRSRKELNGSFCLAQVYSVVLSIALLFVSSAEALDVRISGNKLSLQAERVFLQTILQRMAEQGVSIRIDPELNPKISASFKNRDMKKALSSILKSVDYLLVWKSLRGPRGEILKLDEIQIFRKNRKEQMILLAPAKPVSHIASSVGGEAKGPKEGPLSVNQEILVRLKKGMSLAEFEKLLSIFGGEILEDSGTLAIYKIRLPENSDVSSVVQEISSHPQIDKAEPNYVYPIIVPSKLFASSAVAPDLSNIKVPDNAAPIAILDSGLMPGSGLNDLVLASLDALNPDQPISDSQGHGTQMAFIAAGVVKPDGVESDSATFNPIIPIRAFDDNGLTSSFDIIKSIDFAMSNGAKVMSLSWGSETKSEFLEEAFEQASSKGFIIVASAGNEPTGKPVYPAAYSSVIGIGALDPDGRTWEKSNYGDFVELKAPGFATLPVGYNGEAGSYAGTSISAAYVANMIASYLSQNPGATKKDAFENMKSIFLSSGENNSE